LNERFVILAPIADAVFVLFSHGYTPYFCANKI